MKDNDNTIEQIKNIFGNIIEECAKDRTLLCSLKHFAVTHSRYGLASHLRDLEKASFDLSAQDLFEIEMGHKLSKALEMMGYKMDDSTAWKIAATINKFNEVKDDFSLNDVAKIQVKSDELYPKIKTT